MIMLVFVEGSQKGQRYPIENDTTTLGRERNNDVPVDDPLASRVHVTLTRQAGDLILRDMGSTNGTFVNSKQVHEMKVRHGDRIAIGDTVILIENRMSTEAPRVLVSDHEHDDSADIAVKIDSTTFFSTEAVGTAQFQAQQHLHALFDFISGTTGTLDLDALLREAIDRMGRTVAADRGAILFLDNADQLTAQVLYPKPDSNVTVSRTITEKVLQNHQAILSTAGSDALSKSKSLCGSDVGSILCVPLLVEDTLVGVIYLDTRLNSPAFTEASLRLLSAMAIHLAALIQNARMLRSVMNAEEFASCILKSLSSGVIVIDNRDVVNRANEAALQILEIEQKDLVGLPMPAVQQLRPFASIVAQTKATGIPTDRAEIAVRIGEREKPLGFSTSIMEDYASHSTGVVCTFQDLTKLKKLSDEVKRSQRLASLGEMATGIAHEIRNPLNSVRGFAQLLQEGAQRREHAEDAEFSEIVISEVDRINGIVQDMLDFSRQQELAMSPQQPAEILRALVTQLTPEFDSMEVTLASEIPEASDPVVMGNRDKLVQLLLNMIRNAGQACEKGGRVRLALEIAKNPNGVYPEAVVSIQDDGCGISRENLERIFNPFFTTKDVGTGLGLPICQKIAEQHAGRIEVDSTLGLGTTFRICLPMREDL